MRISSTLFRGDRPSQSRPDAQTSSTETGVESGIPLQEMQRSSTETTRRNGFRQSVAPDRATRIMEDIQSGSYLCSICTDTVAQAKPNEYCMWQCESCYNVFHLDCIKPWAEPPAGPGIIRHVSWTCPLCFVLCHQLPRATCWCGKRSSGNVTVKVTRDRPVKPNSCSQLCAKVATCTMHNQPTAPCPKTCHPGPCNQPCKTNCGDLPQNVEEKPNAWARLRSRFSSREQGLLGTLVWLTIFTTGLELAILFFTIKHIRWWTQPWRYQHFTEGPSEYECLVLIFVGLLVVLPGQFGNLISWASSVSSFSTYLFNLDDTETRKGLKALTKLFGLSVLVIVVISAILAPTIAIIHGPKMVWYYQFRHSCKGFETRVKMDERIDYQTGRDSGIKPTQVFNFRSLDHEGKFPPFYLGAHFETKSHNDTLFQYYYRFGGTTSHGHNLAVDVDTDGWAWRMLLLNGLDAANNWLSQTSRGPSMLGKSRLPQLPELTESLIRNGTFDFNTTIPGHIYIPQLDFMIGNIIDFIRRCEYEPFIRVYNLEGLNTTEKQALGRMPWTSRSGDRVLMRGASFGHGRRRLDMCLREGPITPQTVGENIADKDKVADELMVPLAIIAALRYRVWESHDRDFQC